jgi:hypothetical protein
MPVGGMVPSSDIINKKSLTRLIVWSCLSGESRNMSEWTTPCSAEGEIRSNQKLTYGYLKFK